MKKFYNHVEIVGYYNLDGEYLIFDDNPFHGKAFSNVNVEIKTETHKMGRRVFEEDVIYIDNEEPIRCELVSADSRNNRLILRICQDWG